MFLSYVIDPRRRSVEQVGDGYDRAAELAIPRRPSSIPCGWIRQVRTHPSISLMLPTLTQSQRSVCGSRTTGP
jgi:hypothetical protein